MRSDGGLVPSGDGWDAGGHSGLLLGGLPAMEMHFLGCVSSITLDSLVGMLLLMVLMLGLVFHLGLIMLEKRKMMTSEIFAWQLALF